MTLDNDSVGKRTKALIRFDKPTTFVILGSSVHYTNAKLLVENANESSVYLTDDYSYFELVGGARKSDGSCDGFISLLSLEEFKVWRDDKLAEHRDDDGEDLSFVAESSIFVVSGCTGVDVAITWPDQEYPLHCNDFDLNNKEEECILHQQTEQKKSIARYLGHDRFDSGVVSLFLRDGSYAESTTLSDFDSVVAELSKSEYNQLSPVRIWADPCDATTKELIAKAYEIIKAWEREGKTQEEILRGFGYMLDMPGNAATDAKAATE